jgi:aspartate ammonia-lyase
VNARLGLIPASALPAIEQACAEMAAGSLNIPAIDAYQGGAGTSTNLATRAFLFGFFEAIN